VAAVSVERSPTKWLDFYRPHFATEAGLAEFVGACASQVGPRAAKLIMHQVRRLVMLADQMGTLRPDRDSLHVFWYVVCAEAASKLQADYAKDDQSRVHVRRFFEEFASKNDQNSLASGFQHPDDLRPMTLREAADVLYDVRCDVAHEGNYWDFTLAAEIPMINVAQPAIVSLRRSELRDIVVRTGIRAAQSRLPKASGAAT
jgi:hypothetical protein